MAKLVLLLAVFYSVLLALKTELWQSLIFDTTTRTRVLLALKTELWQSYLATEPIRDEVLLALKTELWQSTYGII